MPTHFKGSVKEVRALDAYIKLMRATDTLQALVQQQLGGVGLTIGQFGVLEALYHLGPMSQKDLARKLLRSSANICTVIDNLERSDLVVRERAKEDRRVVRVSLTRQGQGVVQRALGPHVALIVGALSELTAAEQELLAALCKKLGTSLSARRHTSD